MQHPDLTVLAVDDEEFNLEILVKHLTRASYHALAVQSGEAAWEVLQEDPDKIDIILLDKMMPGMNGIELLKRMKVHPRLRDIPVIMQTASVASEHVIEGLEAGVYYYLTKPFDPKMLLSIVNAAARDLQQFRELRLEAEKNQHLPQLLSRMQCRLQTHDEARELAVFLSCAYPDPERMMFVLSELIANAVEHGNLEIGYHEKARLMAEGGWKGEVARRQELPENAEKYVTVDFERDDRAIRVIITDEGEGFEWKVWKDFDPLRATEPNGRGIAKANAMVQFVYPPASGAESSVYMDAVEPASRLPNGTISYDEQGNSVTCVVVTGE